MKTPISRETCQQLGRQFHELRLQKRLTIYQVFQQTGLQTTAIDTLEIGRGNLPLALYLKLAKFYHKTVKIELVDSD